MTSADNAATWMFLIVRINDVLKLPQHIKIIGDKTRMATTLPGRLPDSRDYGVKPSLNFRIDFSDYLGVIQVTWPILRRAWFAFTVQMKFGICIIENFSPRLNVITNEILHLGLSKRHRSEWQTANRPNGLLQIAMLRTIQGPMPELCGRGPVH